MSHYFTDNRDLSHDYKEINLQFENISFSFMSDSGVFSKNKIDEGSRLLIEAVYKNQIEGKCLDLGCGYGIISIVLKKLLNIDVYGVDINPRAVELAVKNAMKNKLDIKYYVSNGFDKINDRFNNIILNPPIRAGKEIIYKLFDDSYEHLIENGFLWIVIRKQHGAQSALKKLNEKFECEIINKEKGYWLIKAMKRWQFEVFLIVW